MKIVGRTETPDALQFYDAEMLFSRGDEFLENRHFSEARQYFQKLLNEFPDSQYQQPALYNLGVSLLETGDAAGALARFDQFMGVASNERDKLDAQYKRGACLAALGRYDDVVEVFEGLIARTDLDANDRIEALVDSGIGYFMLGDRASADYRLSQAVRLHNTDPEARFDNDYHYAQALFYLGEIARLEFSEYPLTLIEGPAAETKMANMLEEKCQRLLRAQYALLKTIRTGHVGWASAAGYKVGTMYEELHDEMVKLQTPLELDPEQQELYRRELRKKVAILVRKAIGIYENTVRMAKRTGAENVWVGRTEASLERMRQLLKEVDTFERDDKASS
jgi:tetratricopeptide (TPR) repeat protein